MALTGGETLANAPVSPAALLFRHSAAYKRAIMLEMIAPTCCAKTGSRLRHDTHPKAMPEDWIQLQLAMEFLAGNAGDLTLASHSSGTAFKAIAFPTASNSPDITTKPFKAFWSSGSDRCMTAISLLYRMHS